MREKPAFPSPFITHRVCQTPLGNLQPKQYVAPARIPKDVRKASQRGLEGKQGEEVGHSQKKTTPSFFSPSPSVPLCPWPAGLPRGEQVGQAQRWQTAGARVPKMEWQIRRKTLGMVGLAPGNPPLANAPIWDCFFFFFCFGLPPFCPPTWVWVSCNWEASSARSGNAKYWVCLNLQMGGNWWVLPFNAIFFACGSVPAIAGTSKWCAACASSCPSR